jgi:predicted NACHT family NTPase
MPLTLNYRVLQTTDVIFDNINVLKENTKFLTSCRQWHFKIFPKPTEHMAVLSIYEIPDIQPLQIQLSSVTD